MRGVTGRFARAGAAGGRGRLGGNSDMLRGRFAGIDLDALVDWRVVRTWLYWGMFWLLVAPRSAGAVGLFNFPDYLGTH